MDGKVITPYLHWENQFHRIDTPIIYSILQEEERDNLDHGKLLKCKSCGDIFDSEAHEWAIKSKSNKKENKEIRLNLLERSVCKDCSALVTKRLGKKKIRERVSGPNNPNWLGGISFEPYCSKFNEEFKERVRTFWGRKCGICGKPEISEKRRLSVHHVNYDKKTCCNNTKPLFIPLCQNHHIKTNFNREYWEQTLTNYIMLWFNGECYNPKQEDTC